MRTSTADDLVAVAAIHRDAWGGDLVVAHGRPYHLATLPTLVAVTADGRVVGALAFVIEDGALEVVSIAAIEPGRGVGTALLHAAAGLARTERLRRLWLVTTNDNLDALRFYQRRGMRIVAVAPGAVDHSRQLKPSIPEVGAYGIPLHDELTLELDLPVTC